MVEQDDNNKDLLAFLNHYSVQEITSIFAEIDEKILSLHSCSSDDFLTLNAYFKKYYTDSKTISKNATNLFNIITNEESRQNYLLQLQKFIVLLQDLLNKYEEFVNGIIFSIEQMIQEMDKMFVTANNLKQDIMTLKLLVANLKLDIIVSAFRNGKIAQKTNDFNELIIQTRSFFIEFYKHSNVFKDELKALNQNLIQQRSRNVQQINDIITGFNLASLLLDQKYKDAIQLVPKLSESTNNTSVSIDKIITNLQYQDIIRQKIDHIQQTHKDIIKKIDDIKDTGNIQSNLESKLGWFIQIRDIAGLQSAQLIHANKEYQKAIEIISEKFLEVGNDMTSISELCQHLTGNQLGSSVTYFDEIKDKLEKTGYFSELFEKSLGFIQGKIESENRHLKELVNNFEELSDFLFTIDKSIIKSLDHQIPIESEQYESTESQIRNILSEIRNINNLYQGQFTKIKENTFCDYELINNSIYSLKTRLKDFSMNCEQLVSGLYENNENVFKIIVENQVLSQKISADIKNSLEQIKYYDFFDKVIEEIIFKLNDVNQRLQSIDGSKNENYNIDYLRQRYTMQSEHTIHDSISMEKTIDQFDFNSTGADEDDDNLELF